MHPLTEHVAPHGCTKDELYREDCGVAGLGNALTVLTTVVARPTPGRAIIDAGRETLDVEIAMPRVCGRPGVEFERMSAEHGRLRVAPEAPPLTIGDRLEVVPGYEDLTVFLHDHFYGLRDGRLVEILPIAGYDGSR